MEIFIVGLVLFLGLHSVRIFAEGWRTRTIASIGALPWKGIYSVLSIASFVLLVWGYGMTRAAPPLWYPPVWTKHITILLVLMSFILLAAAYVPGNGIKARVGHPMILGVKVWALAHLISNGRLGDMLLFGAFLLWAILDFKAARGRDKAAGTTYPSLGAGRTAAAIALGVVAYLVFMMFLHTRLIGVRPY